MTEADWLAATDPTPMLAELRDEASERKLRLFLVECASRVLPSSPDDAMVDALAAATRFADGSAKKSELSRSSKTLRTSHADRYSRWPILYTSHIRSIPAWHATRQQVFRAACEGASVCVVEYPTHIHGKTCNGVP